MNRTVVFCAATTAVSTLALLGQPHVAIVLTFCTFVLLLEA